MGCSLTKCLPVDLTAPYRFQVSQWATCSYSSPWLVWIAVPLACRWSTEATCRHHLSVFCSNMCSTIVGRTFRTPASWKTASRSLAFYFWTTPCRRSRYIRLDRKQECQAPQSRWISFSHWRWRAALPSFCAHFPALLRCQSYTVPWCLQGRTLEAALQSEC